MKALWACGLMALLGCSRAQPAGPQLRAWRVSTPVVIDGELAEPGWLKAPTTGAWRDATEASRVVPHTEARAVFDDDALVIGFYLADEDIQSTDHVGVTIGDATWELPPNAPMRGPDSATGAAEFDGTLNDARDDDEEWAAELKVPWSALGLRGPPDELRVALTRNDTPRGVPERHLLWRGRLVFR